MDDGLGGPFTLVYEGLALTFTYTEVARGRQYRARYRARNVNGWSEYSPIGFMLASQVPSKPTQPIFV